MDRLGCIREGGVSVQWLTYKERERRRMRAGEEGPVGLSAIASLTAGYDRMLDIDIRQMVSWYSFFNEVQKQNCYLKPLIIIKRGVRVELKVLTRRMNRTAMLLGTLSIFFNRLVPTLLIQLNVYLHGVSITRNHVC